MQPYVILADACCDLSEDVRSAIGMTDYLTGHVYVEDGRNFPYTLDWSQISRSEFYRLLSNKKCKVTTAPPNMAEYIDVFERYVSEGYAIISLSLSSKISSTFNTARLAAEQVCESHPDAKIYCFDTLRMSGGFGLLTIYAHQLKAEGKSFDEVVDFLEKNKRSVHQMGPIDDLFFVARRGRIGMGKAIMGSLIGIKPMGDCSADGYTEVLGNARGIPQALDITVKYVKATAVDMASQTVLVVHSDRETYAQTLAERLQNELSPKTLYISEVFPGCGANIGPGMVGVYYLGGEILEGMEAEKDIMKTLLGKN